MGRFYIKQGDTSPAKKDRLVDGEGEAIDLTDASVDFHMVSEDGSVIVDGTASVTDAPNGEVVYGWSEGDTEDTGVYEAEWEVEFPTGRIETFPNSYNLLVIVEDQLA